jgi:bifunctional DNA-binding transcriptional regulator/antitoxin component of YhaV-PrlF toxin-antitoxin module
MMANFLLLITTMNKNNMKTISKILEPTGDVYIKFTDEELEQFNIKSGDKFSIIEQDDGILLKKYETIEIDISEFSREVLEMLIKESIEKSLPVEDILEDIISQYIKTIDEN